MKKVSKLLFGIVIGLFSIITVKAEECKNYTMRYEAGLFNTQTVQILGVDTQQMLTFRDNSGAVVPGYCRNAAKSTGANEGGTTYTCRSTVFDATTASVKSDLRKAYEAGIVKILSTGYNLKNKSSGIVGYTATDLAVKTFELLSPESINTGTSGGDSAYLQAFKAFANQMLNDREIGNLLTQVYGSKRETYGVSSGITFASNDSQIKNTAREYIKMGLEAAKEYKSNGAASISWNTNPNVTKGTILDNGNYTGSISYTFNIKNFTSNGSYARLHFSCENCNQNGVSYVLIVDDENNNQNYGDEIDLLSKVTNGTGNVTIKVVFTGDSNYGCEELDYNIRLNYKDDSISNEVYDMYPNNCPGNACQHFYVLKNTNVEKVSTISDSFAMCNLSCKELQTRCNLGNSKACSELNKQYPNGCVNCGVGVVNNECADPGETSDLNLIEGYEVDSENCTQGTEENIKGCILDNKDAAGNSYVDSNLGNPNNCSVSCKEDFHFVLPGNMDVSNGRYFSLKTNVKATKTCYLKMIGNPESAIKAFENAAEGTYSAYNSCQKASAISALNCTPQRETIKCGKKINHRSVYKNSKNEPCKSGDDDCTLSNEEYYSDITISADYYKCEYQYKVKQGCGITTVKDIYESHAEIKKTGDSCTITSAAVPPSTSDSKSAATSSCDNLDEMNAKPTYVTVNVPGLSGAKAYVIGGSYSYSIGGSSNSIYNSLGNYNACAFWEMDYDFNPDMYFSYEETYMKSVLTDKLDLVGEITKGSTTHYYCRGNTDDSYKLCFDESGNETSWSTEPLFAGKRVCVCSGSGCSYESIAVNDTKSMKESITYEATFITPTQFYSIYPTGEIAIGKSCDGIENCQELTNALPVGFGTPQGGHHYALYAKNLGQYYNDRNSHKSGDFGRVWGDSDSVVATTLKSNNECAIDGALKYDADVYEYIKDGVWVCNYCVNGNCDDNICIKNDGTEVDMTGCMRNDTKENCKKKLCGCPDCPPVVGYKCMNINGKYYGSTGAEVNYQTYKQQCCPANVCPVTIILPDGKNFIYRPISTEYIEPDNRELGLNWKYDDKQVSTALEMKAAVTTNEIIADGETIYEDDNKYVMKVNLDSSLINDIKNRKDKDYASNTLKCYDYKQGSNTYNNIFCYSTFIDELVNNNKTKDKISFSVERPLSEAKRKDSQNSEYWTTWTKKLENSKWSINTTRELSYYKSNYSKIGIGPSWK